MGTWGTAISSNDTYADIYSEFMDMYNDGLEVPEITLQLLKSNQDLIDDRDGKNDFWFAIAMAQWECKSLDNDIYKRVRQIVESGEDIELWKKQNADKKDVTKREKVLKLFIEKISIEKPKAKRRKRKVFRDSIFETGDCLIFKLTNGNFGAAVVLTSEKQTEYGMNLIATTTINQSNKPTIDDIKKSNVLIQKDQIFPGTYREREIISWYFAQFYKRCDIDFIIIGKLNVNRQFNFNNEFTNISSWDMIKETIDTNESVIKELGKPKKKLKLKKLIKNQWLNIL